MKTHRPRKLRLDTPAERPLDDGPRFGPEPWREIDGVTFCHWDRWLLRLALTEPEGLLSIEREFRRRAQNDRRKDWHAEAFVAQVVDLRARLASVGRAPEAVLDEQERASEWLQAKAFRRVWHGSVQRTTEAMRRTPRAVLSERALRGNWALFSVSPLPYSKKLEAVVGDGWHDQHGAGIVVTLLRVSASDMVFDAQTGAERLAIHRGALTAIIEAMGRIDDSLGEAAELFREHEVAYLDLVLDSADLPAMVSDLLELIVWEDYGLFARITAFFRRLSEHEADCAMHELARIIAELRSQGLQYQLTKAQQLRKDLIEAAASTFLQHLGGDGSSNC